MTQVRWAAVSMPVANVQEAAVRRMSKCVSPARFSRSKLAHESAHVSADLDVGETTQNPALPASGFEGQTSFKNRGFGRTKEVGFSPPHPALKSRSVPQRRALDVAVLAIADAALDGAEFVSDVAYSAALIVVENGFAFPTPSVRRIPARDELIDPTFYFRWIVRFRQTGDHVAGCPAVSEINEKIGDDGCPFSILLLGQGRGVWGGKNRCEHVAVGLSEILPEDARRRVFGTLKAAMKNEQK
jgi:hypothetical protein